MMTKRILIIGAHSYIGKSLQKSLQTIYNNYEVDMISVRTNEWRLKDFSKYDSVVHTAAIVHSKHQTSELYYKINRDLTVDIATKSKIDGVKQFLFISSMAVYGLESGVITNKTIPHPKNDYGKSKLEAEKILENMRSKDFVVSIVRPPMVYGNGAKGNYNILRKIALLSPLIPNVKNKRSMLYIDNFVMTLENIINQSVDGIFHPQNSEYMETSRLMKEIRLVHSKKSIMSTFLGRCVGIVQRVPGSVGTKATKAFGTLQYSKELEQISYKGVSEREISIKDSIKRTEKKTN